MRPDAIKHFEVFMLLSLAIAFVMTLSNWDTPGIPQSAGVLVLSGLLIMLALTLWVSRIGNSFARWVFIVFMVIGFVFYIPTIPVTFVLDPVGAGISLVSGLLQFAALSCLMKREARAWFLRARF